MNDYNATKKDENEKKQNQVAQGSEVKTGENSQEEMDKRDKQSDNQMNK